MEALQKLLKAFFVIRDEFCCIVEQKQCILTFFKVLLLSQPDILDVSSQEFDDKTDLLL